MYSPGPSQWAFDGDCRWLWLDSLFCLCPLVQDHTYDVGVPSDTLLPLPRLLLLQWANVGAAGSAHLLGRAYLAHGHQIPARQRMNRYFQFPPHPPHRTFISSWQLFTFSQFQFFFPLFFLLDRKLSRMSGATKRRPSQKTKVLIASWGKNLKTATCRMATQPSTTTTIRGTDWIVRGGDEADDGPSRAAFAWKPKNRSAGLWKWQHTETHTHIPIISFSDDLVVWRV